MSKQIFNFSTLVSDRRKALKQFKNDYLTPFNTNASHFRVDNLIMGSAHQAINGSANASTQSTKIGHSILDYFQDILDKTPDHPSIRTATTTLILFATTLVTSGGLGSEGYSNELESWVLPNEKNFVDLDWSHRFFHVTNMTSWQNAFFDSDSGQNDPRPNVEIHSFDHHCILRNIETNETWPLYPDTVIDLRTKQIRKLKIETYEDDYGDDTLPNLVLEAYGYDNAPEYPVSRFAIKKFQRESKLFERQRSLRCGLDHLTHPDVYAGGVTGFMATINPLLLYRTYTRNNTLNGLRPVNMRGKVNLIFRRAVGNGGYTTANYFKPHSAFVIYDGSYSFWTTRYFGHGDENNAQVGGSNPHRIRVLRQIDSSGKVIENLEPQVLNQYTILSRNAAMSVAYVDTNNPDEQAAAYATLGLKADDNYRLPERYNQIFFTPSNVSHMLEAFISSYANDRENGYVGNSPNNVGTWDNWVDAGENVDYASFDLDIPEYPFLRSRFVGIVCNFPYLLKQLYVDVTLTYDSYNTIRPQ